jgi:cation diffusion facilitator family transporter
MAMEKYERISIIGVLLNIILFSAKIIIALLSNSLALMSDTFNSLTDIVSYTAIYVAVKVSNKKPDSDHQFGHHRAEPIAGLIVSVFAALLAFQVLNTAITSFSSPRHYAYEYAAIGVLLFTMIVKSLMYLFFTKIGVKHNRPAIKAAGIDSRNDVLVSSIALIGVIGPWIGMPLFDSIAALVISMIIFYSAYKIGIENVDFLMGKSPPQEILDRVKNTVLRIRGVKGINDFRAHYVGNYIHVEIHIEVDKDMKTQRSHNIGKKVQAAVEKHYNIEKAFIHIDPVS